MICTRCHQEEADWIFGDDEAYCQICWEAYCDETWWKLCVPFWVEPVIPWKPESRVKMRRQPAGDVAESEPPHGHG